MESLISNKPERMKCMEIWGGNRAIEKSFEAPGIDIHVHSAPYQDSEVGGGDIYYVTSCASGRISRILLADVSGHGEAVSQIAVSLRDLMRDNVNRISQKQFVMQMNRDFGQQSEDSGFATAVVATFFEPKKSLSISVAGHPYPIYYRAAKQRWLTVDATTSSEGIENLPLGIYEDSDYRSRRIETETDDMFLLYSDAFIESVDQQGKQVGTQGLIDLLNQGGPADPAEVIPFLRHELRAMSGQNLLDDDASLILGHFTSKKVNMKDNLMALFRLAGNVSDKTCLVGPACSIEAEKR